MKKKIIAVLICIVTLSLCIAIPLLAEGLPIDINAIGRRGLRDDQPTVRIGAHLFTADAQRVNYAFEEQIRRRQAIASYLFADVPLNYEVEPHEQVINTTTSLGLFSQPANFANVNIHQTADPVPLWIFALLIPICALGGFIWAIASHRKKKGQAESVY